MAVINRKNEVTTTHTPLAFNMGMEKDTNGVKGGKIGCKGQGRPSTKRANTKISGMQDKGKDSGIKNDIIQSGEKGETTQPKWKRRPRSEIAESITAEKETLIVETSVKRDVGIFMQNASHLQEPEDA